MVSQPFLNYNFPNGVYLTNSPIVTADWEADSSQRWTVPLGGYSNVLHPDNGSNWELRVQVQLMFPQ